VETWAHGITAPSAAYEVGGRHVEIGSPGFAKAIVDAHAAHQRPRCMCLVEGVEMYVARLGDGYIVKRMPDTGCRHAPDCLSYEPPAEFSGLGQVLGSAIIEDPATGETMLKLDFPLTKMPGRSQMPPTGGDSDSVTSEGTKLSLRGLLHYLWDQAELTRWHPGFAGKRTWATVRRHLLQAAENKIAKGDLFRSRLFIPEVFSVEQRDAINARRLAQWANAVASAGKSQLLMLMIAEVKEFVPSRYGYKAVIKHVPDQAFALDERLYRRLGRHFEAELGLWGASDSLRLVMIATFGVSDVGMPAITELSLMPVSLQWLPVEGSPEHQLIERLTRENRSFFKALRYSIPATRMLPCAILTDTHESPTPLWISRDGSDDREAVARNSRDAARGGPQRSWVWNVVEGSMPQLPALPRSSDP
jgi:hypothetical protein